MSHHIIPVYSMEWKQILNLIPIFVSDVIGWNLYLLMHFSTGSKISETWFIIYGFSFISNFETVSLKPYSGWAFSGLLTDWGGGGPFWTPFPKIRHTYPTVMKLGTVIPYLRKIQKMYKSRDTFLEFCWNQHFFTWNQQILLHQEINI